MVTGCSTWSVSTGTCPRSSSWRPSLAVPWLRWGTMTGLRDWSPTFSQLCSLATNSSWICPRNTRGSPTLLWSSNWRTEVILSKTMSVIGGWTGSTPRKWPGRTGSWPQLKLSISTVFPKTWQREILRIYLVNTALLLQTKSNL